MRIVISEFMSLDGVVQAPGGPGEDTDGGFRHGGWSMPYFDPEVMGRAMDELMSRTDAMLFGRRTYVTSAAVWPGVSGDPFSDKINIIPKYVASRTLTEDDLTWAGSRLLPADDALGAVRALRESDGGVLQVYGSADLVTQLLAADLVDELQVVLEPVLLGRGKRAFPVDDGARPLRLTSVQQTATGALVCRYEVVRD